jgi:hypothetical protein
MERIRSGRPKLARSVSFENIDGHQLINFLNNLKTFHNTSQTHMNEGYPAFE